MESNEREYINSETETTCTAMKSKRTRTTLKPLPNSLGDSDENISSSASESSDCELSEDEWNIPSKKYGKNKKKSGPKQTLKMKLAEKTKHLRKISKLNSNVQIQTDMKCVVESKTAVEPPENKIRVDNNNSSIRVKPKTELCKEEEAETKCLHSDSKNSLGNVIKHDSDTIPSLPKLNVKKESVEKACVVIKEEKKKEIVQEDRSEQKISPNKEPIVIMYSINRPPTAVENQTSATISSPSPAVNHSPLGQNQSTPLPMNAFIPSDRNVSSEIPNVVSQSTPTGFHSNMIFSGNSSGSGISTVASRNFLSNQTVSQPVENNAPHNINRMTTDGSVATAQYFSCNNNVCNRSGSGVLPKQYSPSTAKSRNLSNRLNSSPSNLRASPTMQRTPPQRSSTCFQRTPSAIRQPPKTIQRTPSALQPTPIPRITRTPRSGDNSASTRTSKLFSPGRNERSSSSINAVKRNALLSAARNTTPSKSTYHSPFVTRNSPSNLSTNSMLKKLNNISPNGTVIHTGTGSVTITPRKISPERPPVQRKLFKNEIEGAISCRSVRGTLQYVVNLANGTHIPLSNLQVQKLREQHNGVLPVKLKIPVPCDVADQIEPSFLIED